MIVRWKKFFSASDLTKIYSTAWFLYICWKAHSNISSFGAYLLEQTCATISNPFQVITLASMVLFFLDFTSLCPFNSPCKTVLNITLGRDERYAYYHRYVLKYTCKYSILGISDKVQFSDVRRFNKQWAKLLWYFLALV